MSEHDNHIVISLEWKGQQVDLEVPSNVTPNRLIELLAVAFQKNGGSLPERWRFVVEGKKIDLESGLTLEELQLGNGEILKIIAGAENDTI